MNKKDVWRDADEWPKSFKVDNAFHLGDNLWNVVGHTGLMQRVSFIMEVRECKLMDVSPSTVWAPTDMWGHVITQNQVDDFNVEIEKSKREVEAYIAAEKRYGLL